MSNAKPQTGADRLRNTTVPLPGAAPDPGSQLVDIPRLTLRDHFVTQAPPAPAWWKIRTPLDSARWAWAWADALLATRDEPTNPTSAERLGDARPR